MTTLRTSPQARPVPGKRKRDMPQGKLLRGYLHKTSNSLCGIKGYAGLIARRDQPQDSIVAWAQKIICEVEKMESIYRSVGDLARPALPLEAGADLGRVLAQAWDHCSRRFPFLKVDMPDLPACRVLLPAADLFQVFTELLTNSAQGRTGEQLPVRVAINWQSDKDKLSLRVEDDGPGLDPVISGQVLNPFVTTKPGHVGIGLTRVETILDIHAVEWSLDSQPGLGTVVTMQITEMKNGLLAQNFREEGA